MQCIHINCDLGEGGSHDAQIMPHISACNIACGGHAGTQKTMKETVQLALEYHVEIGAHPSFPDMKNFGRKPMNISKMALKHSLLDQIRTLEQIVMEKGGKLNHIKPHGALYHEVSKNEEIAKLFLEVVTKFDVSQIFAPPQSVIKTLASPNIKIEIEAFGDRNYENNFTLVSREKNNALITKKEAVFEQIFNVYFHQKISLGNGVEKPFFAHTFCLHGDAPNTVENLEFLIRKLETKNIQICKS